MSKSLTSTHASLLQTREEIDAKIQELETKLGNGIITLIQKNNGFKVPYSLLCGAILETLDTLDLKKDKHADWHQQGERFLRSISESSKNSKSKSVKKDDTIRAA